MAKNCDTLQPMLTFTEGAALIILIPERCPENAAATALLAVLLLVKATLPAIMELIGKRIIFSNPKNQLKQLCVLQYGQSLDKSTVLYENLESATNQKNQW